MKKDNRFMDAKTRNGVHSALKAFDADGATIPQIEEITGFSKAAIISTLRRGVFSGWFRLANGEANPNDRIYIAREPKKREHYGLPVKGAQQYRDYLRTQPEPTPRPEDNRHYEVRRENRHGYIIVTECWSLGWAKIEAGMNGGEIVEIS